MLRPYLPGHRALGAIHGPRTLENTMKFFLTFLLGIGTVSAVACRSHQTAEMKAETVTLAVSGMT